MTHPKDIVEAVALAMLQAHFRQNGMEPPTELGPFDNQYRLDARAALAALPANGMVGELVSGLEAAVLQLEYLDERSPTGTTPATIARLNALIVKAKGAGGWAAIDAIESLQDDNERLREALAEICREYHDHSGAGVDVMFEIASAALSQTRD